VGVTPDQVRAVAALARLDLEGEQAIAMAEQLSRILDHMRELEAVDLENVDPTAPEPERAPVRADHPAPDPLAFPPADMAPGWDHGFFTLPRLPALGDAARVSGASGPDDAPEAS
jgi:aspartyl-tRNA(Asn)/glutamyl-tRNA(Gln) amidotransferase subunit C